MINHYSLLPEIAHQRQQEMLRQAETEHLSKQLKRKRPGLLQHVVHRLLTAARQLTAHSHSNPATPIFSER